LKVGVDKVVRVHTSIVNAMADRLQGTATSEPTIDSTTYWKKVPVGAKTRHLVVEKM
jgi:hypothetical protein